MVCTGRIEQLLILHHQQTYGDGTGCMLSCCRAVQIHFIFVLQQRLSQITTVAGHF